MRRSFSGRTASLLVVAALAVGGGITATAVPAGTLAGPCCFVMPKDAPR